MLVEGNKFSVYGPGHEGESRSQLLGGQMDPTFCPVPNFFDDRIGAKLDVVELANACCEFDIGTTHVTARRVNHLPGVSCLGYRLEGEGGSLAYIPDVEYRDESQQQPSLDLARGVDVLIHDAYHDSTDRAGAQPGCGHSSDRDAFEIARSAGAKRVLLFHHHPDRNDDEIDRVVATYRSEALMVEAAREGADYSLNGIA
jgi:ribonuclease BN (tRNA processing enzyme)